MDGRSLLIRLPEGKKLDDRTTMECSYRFLNMLLKQRIGRESYQETIMRLLAKKALHAEEKNGLPSSIEKHFEEVKL